MYYGLQILYDRAFIVIISEHVDTNKKLSLLIKKKLLFCMRLKIYSMHFYDSCLT